MKNHLDKKDLKIILLNIFTNIEIYAILSLLLVAIVIFYQSGFFYLLFSSGRIFYAKNIFIRVACNIMIILAGLLPILLFVYLCYKYIKDKNYINNLFKVHKYFMRGILLFVVSMFLVSLFDELYYRYLIRKDSVDKYFNSSLSLSSSPNGTYGTIIVIFICLTSLFLSFYSYYKYLKSNKSIYRKVLILFVYSLVCLFIYLLNFVLVMTLTTTPK